MKLDLEDGITAEIEDGLHKNASVDDTNKVALISIAVSLKRIADIMQKEWLEKKGYSQPVTPR